MAVKWTKTALANLAAILEYIADDNPDRARSFALEVQEKTNSLVEFPGIGVPEVAPPGQIMPAVQRLTSPNASPLFQVGMPGALAIA